VEMTEKYNVTKRLPDFFIVGAQKSGTTSMNNYLQQHPSIFIPKKKESHFFGSDLNFKFGGLRDRRFYLSLFDGVTTEKRVGETSVWYLYSKMAAKEIKAFSPSASIIIMLRNPVDMIYSLHSEFLYDGNEDINDFESALEAEQDRKKGLRIPKGAHLVEGLFYREVAKYTKQVKRYIDTFGRDKVHIIIFDDFKNDLSTVYVKTLRFLGVNDDYQPDFRVINPNKRARSRLLRGLLNDPSPTTKGIGRLLVPRPLRNPLFLFLKQFNKKYMPRQPIDPQLRKCLQMEFAPEVKKLSHFIGKDLNYWTDK
jgi:hypothetical protein